MMVTEDEWECFRSAKYWVSQMGFSVAVGHAEDTRRVELKKDMHRQRKKLKKSKHSKGKD